MNRIYSSLTRKKHIFSYRFQSVFFFLTVNTWLSEAPQRGNYNMILKVKDVQQFGSRDDISNLQPTQNLLIGWLTKWQKETFFSGGECVKVGHTEVRVVSGWRKVRGVMLMFQRRLDETDVSSGLMTEVAFRPADTMEKKGCPHRD